MRLSFLSTEPIKNSAVTLISQGVLVPVVSQPQLFQSLALSNFYYLPAVSAKQRQLYSGPFVSFSASPRSRCNYRLQFPLKFKDLKKLRFLLIKKAFKTFLIVDQFIWKARGRMKGKRKQAWSAKCLPGFCQHKSNNSH